MGTRTVLGALSSSGSVVGSVMDSAHADSRPQGGRVAPFSTQCAVVAAPNSPGVDRAVDAALNFYEQSAPQVPAKTERSIPSTETRPERNRHRGVNAASQNIKIAKKAYDAFAAADLETVLSTFDDNVEFVVPGNSTISGTYRGKAKVTEFSRS